VRQGERDAAELAELAEKAVLEACAEIYEMASSTSGRQGMGCTLTIVVVAGPKAVLAHVGDSRLYLCRDGAAAQLTTDHTLTHELAVAGVLTPEEEQTHQFAHVLTRAVGPQPAVRVDALIFDVLPGDRLVLCTDGLSDYIQRTGWLARQVGQQDPERIAEELITFANQAGGDDNITVVVVSVEADRPELPAIAQLKGEVQSKLGALRSVFLFQDLSLALQTRVLEVCTVEPFAAGDTVVREGEQCSCLLVVMEGRCRLVKGGKEIDVLSAGDHVGLTTLLSCRPARASLHVIEPSKILTLEHEAFWELVKLRPWLGVGLLERLGRQLSTRLDRAIVKLDGGEVPSLPGERF